MPKDIHKVLQRLDGKFVVVSTITGNVILDCNGYGFKTEQTALNASNYLLTYGVQKLKVEVQDALKFWDKEVAFAKATRVLIANRFEEVSQLAKEMGIEGYNPEFLDFLGLRSDAPVNRLSDEEARMNAWKKQKFEEEQAAARQKKRAERSKKKMVSSGLTDMFPGSGLEGLPF